MNNETGSKYEQTKDLDIVAIAKLLRQDIKASVKEGRLPAVKYGVRIERYSMGQSIHISVGQELTDEVKAAVRDLADAYNYDRSDPQSDYFCVRFYVHINGSNH